MKRYDYIEVGVNSRLDTIQAAVLLEKLKIFDDEIIKRNEVAEIYKDNLSEIDRIIPPKINLDNNSVYALYTIKLKDINRDDLIRYLNEKSI